MAQRFLDACESSECMLCAARTATCTHELQGCSSNGAAVHHQVLVCWSAMKVYLKVFELSSCWVSTRMWLAVLLQSIDSCNPKHLIMTPSVLTCCCLRTVLHGELPAHLECNLCLIYCEVHCQQCGTARMLCCTGSCIQDVRHALQLVADGASHMHAGCIYRECCQMQYSCQKIALATKLQVPGAAMMSYETGTNGSSVCSSAKNDPWMTPGCST